MTAAHRQRHTVTLSDGRSLQIEAVRRDDWEGLDDTCPECGSTEFEHVQFEGGRYGRSDDAVILRTDYWDRKGSLYTVCKECDKVLYKHPAYDLLRELQWGTSSPD